VTVSITNDQQILPENVTINFIVMWIAVSYSPSCATCEETWQIAGKRNAVE
jgi:hypothetical protein